MTLFEGASKKNKPNLLPGNIILSMVTLAYKEMEPELTCIYSNGQAGGLGLISDGLLIAGLCSSFCRYISTKSCPLLQYLEKSTKSSFSITSANNNRIIIDGEDPSDVVKIRSIMNHVNSLFMGEKDLKKFGNNVKSTHDDEWNQTLSLIDGLFQGRRRPVSLGA